MKFAIISVTEKGQNLAETLLNYLENDPSVIKVDIFHKNVNSTLNDHFHQYDCWVGIMASGIMVRSLCGLIKTKFTDPAVLVVDENGKHVISLLSGHIGGANHFTVKLAGMIGAVPVITTATDLAGKMGVDTLAYQYWLNIRHKKFIKTMNQYIAAGGKVDLDLPAQFDFLKNHPLANKSYNFNKWDKSFIRAIFTDKKVYLTPKRMVAGVGSKKGVTEEQVFFALRSALQYLHLPVDRLDAMATAEIKEEEEGIKLAAIKLNLPLKIISLDKIRHFHHPDCTPSQLVKREFGIEGVSEPTALLEAGENSRLILKKTAYNGVTVAVAVAIGSKLSKSDKLTHNTF